MQFADYYDIYGYYHSDNGYVYTGTGYYDIYGNYYEYSAVSGTDADEDELRVIDPYGYILYVPLFYPAKVDVEKVKEKSADIPVSNIFQMPELPNGCEATAVTIALNYYKFPADKMKIAEKYFYFNFGNPVFKSTCSEAS